MRALLAERLLATVMNWSPEDIARERPPLEILARLKYDEYQQFSPGKRFIESLAYWLNQFETVEERHTAFEFFKSKLIYCSTAEMNHLVSLAYQDHVRPFLLSKAARESGLSPWHFPRVADRQDFKILERQTLYLGLSDGARTDVFRRFNPDLSHEQVRQSHELAEERVDKLLGKLKEALGKILLSKDAASDEACRFRTIVLLDDLSASGYSYLRQENGAWDGKIGTFLAGLFDPKNPVASLVKPADLDVVVVLYMATGAAVGAIKKGLTEICAPVGARGCVKAVYPLSSDVRIERGMDARLDSLIDKYYDNDNETASTKLGGSDVKYGFNACGLPLVLSHNTPNNSIALLWASGSKMRPLFHRVTRHKDRV